MMCTSVLRQSGGILLTGLSLQNKPNWMARATAYNNQPVCMNWLQVCDGNFMDNWQQARKWGVIVESTHAMGSKQRRRDETDWKWSAVQCSGLDWIGNVLGNAAIHQKRRPGHVSWLVGGSVRIWDREGKMGRGKKIVLKSDTPCHEIRIFYFAFQFFLSGFPLCP